MVAKATKVSGSLNATLTELKDRRADLIAQREHIADQINRVDKAISALGDLNSSKSSQGQPAKMGLTDSVRKVMKGSAWLTPTQIRDALSKLGMDVGAYNNILAEVHLILKRLHKGGEVEIDTTKSRKTLYRGKNDR